MESNDIIQTRTWVISISVESQSAIVNICCLRWTSISLESYQQGNLELAWPLCHQSNDKRGWMNSFSFCATGGLVSVLWNRNFLLRFRFRFRFWLLKSYGSGSGSGSNFWKVMVPIPVPVRTFEKVPVPVPAPYLDHKKQIIIKNMEIFLTFYLVSCFTRKKF